MSVYAYIPPVNPIRFVEKDQSFTDEYGHKPYGSASYLDSRSSNDATEPYYQPFKKNNILMLQIHRANAASTKVNFYSAETGVKLHTVTISNPPLILAANIVPGTVDEQLYIQLMALQPATYSQLDDHDLVWIEIEINFGTATKYMLSVAPIYLFTENDEFSKIVYSCNTNKFDCFWANRNPLYYPVFTFYIEAERTERDSAFEHLTYDEMNGTVEELHSNVRDQYTFRAAGPDFMLDILDRALACDNKTIDDRVYTLKEVGEKSGKGTAQTKEYTLTEPDDAIKYTFVNRVVELWERPGYPYAVGNLTLQDASGRTIRLDARILDDSTDETALLSTLNGLALNVASSGTFTESSGTFLFTNGTGEAFEVVTDVQVMTTELELSVNVATNGTTYKHLSSFPDNFDHYHIINYGEGTTIAFDELHASVSGTLTASHLYATSGNYTIRVFHKNEDTIFNATALTGAPKITDIDGDMSSTMERIYLRNQDFSGLAAIDLSFIAPSKDTLTTLVIENSGLDAITSGWASGLVVGVPPNWYRPFYRIGFVSLANNTLSDTEIDTFINELHGSTRWQPGAGKTLNVKFQTPAAPPTGASLTARNAFIAGLWTVFTD